MWPALVVVIDPRRDLRSGVIEPQEQALVEKFIAHAAVEALTEAVLHWLTRCDEMPGDLVGLRPEEHRVRRELRPVVGHDHARSAAPFDQLGQFARYTAARYRSVGDCRQAFSRHVVDDIEDPETPATGELVVDEIQRSIAQQALLATPKGSERWRLLPPGSAPVCPQHAVVPGACAP